MIDNISYTRVGKLADNDEEDDEAWDPTPELVCVDDLVSEQRYDECGNRNYEHTSKPWHIIVHGMYQLGTDDGVYR
jgi:hypothetical protein